MTYSCSYAMPYSYDSNYDPEAVLAAIGSYIACFAVFAILMVALMVFGYWKVLEKAGYSGAWSLLLLVPGLNGIASLGILLFLAFSEWPALRRPAVGSYSPPPYIPPPTYGPPVAPAPQPGYAPPPPPMVAQPAPAAEPAPVYASPPPPPPLVPAEPPAAPAAPPVEPDAGVQD